MKSITIDRLDALFRRFPMLVAEPVPEHELADAQREIGAAFDDDYRDFVSRYGGAMVGSLPVLGLRQAEVMGVDLYSVVNTTLRFRAEGWPGVEDWVVVSVDGSGNPIGLAEDGSVWLADHDSREVRLVSSDFETFIEGLLDEALF